ncbi:MAG: polymer-forming cytoskeletal protein [Gammaproteobacteria bacterium]|nr:polymer-forming cytoskeletal protein [Gammaproteobacteria bacterium]
MFNKDKRKNKTARLDTLIGQHTHIKGDISFSGGLRIDGSVAGDINATGDTKSMPTLSEQGSLEGEIKVPNLILNGTIKGNVYASQHVELAAKAKVQGNVYYNLLEMAMGSQVNGQLIHMPEDSNTVLDLDHEVVDAEEDNLRLASE